MDPYSILELSFVCVPKDSHTLVRMKDFRSALKEDYYQFKDVVNINGQFFVLCNKPKGFLFFLVITSYSKMYSHYNR